MNKTIVELKNITKKFKKNTVFSKLNLAVCENTITTIYGNSGSGKSTLLNIIGLLEKADSGQINLFGNPAPKVNSYRARIILKNRISYLFQNFALMNDETIKKNINIAKLDSSQSWADFNSKKKKLLTKFNITQPENTIVGNLSGGQQQRISLIRSLLKPCDLLLCDEPTGSLDPENKHYIFEELIRVKNEGKTILIVSHDPYIIENSDIAYDIKQLY